VNACLAFSPDVLRIDAVAETDRIVASIRDVVFRLLDRKGAVIDVSGGIDSSVVTFLCARALGKDRVLVLFTPEAESCPDRLRLGQLVAGASGVQSLTEDLSAILMAAQCYDRRDETLMRVIPGYRRGSKCRVVLPSVRQPQRHTLFSVIVQSLDGQAQWVRLSPKDYQSVIAALSFKQRARNMIEYYYADLFQFAVVGTVNRLQYDQGFFVKNGDGAADLKPIAHLYQSQVYQLADYLGIPEEIRRQPPANDTYPLAQSENEAYLMLAPEKMDICLYGKNNGIRAADLGAAVGLDADQVQLVYEAIQTKRAEAKYLRTAPVLVGEVAEV